MADSEVKKLVLTRGIFSEEENARIYHKFFRHWFERNGYIYKRFGLKKTDKILDIGSHYGHNLIHFNPDSTGLEAERRFVDFSRALGLNIVEMNIEEKWSLGGKFNIIWCTDVLPHLFSPYKFLYEARKILSAKGKMVLQMPLMSIFNKHKSPYHLYAFNKKSLSYLLEMAGFKIIKTSGCVRRLPPWFNYLFERPLQKFGGNIWILAVKDEVKINLDKIFPPSWFGR